jgi:hypothetical protein
VAITGKSMIGKIALIASITAAVGATALLAHHSFASEFDTKNPITVTGLVTKFEWTNPHTWIYVQGPDQNGRDTNWSFEGTAPSLLLRRGFGKTTIKVGDKITIEGFRAKDGTDIASSTYVTLADGRKIRTGVVGGPSDEQ